MYYSSGAGKRALVSTSTFAPQGTGVVPCRAPKKSICMAAPEKPLKHSIHALAGFDGRVQLRMWPGECQWAKNVNNEFRTRDRPLLHAVMMASSVNSSQLNGSLFAILFNTGGSVAVLACGSTE